MKLKHKKIIGDISNNIIASIVLTGVAQLLVYPILGYTLQTNEYGKFLTTIGVINTIAVSLGGSLNNTRLLMNEEYVDKKIEGDFNVLLMVSTIFSMFFISIYSWVCVQKAIVPIILCVVLTILIILRGYYSVAYRIKLNYKRNLILSICLAVGFLIGILIYKIAGFTWCTVFLTSEAIGLIYLFGTTDLFKESFTITKLFKKTANKYVILICTGLLANVLIYLDRLLLLPVLGSESVSIYTVASFMGKGLGIVMTPIAGVVLSYYSTKYVKLNKKTFMKSNMIIAVLGILFWIFCLVFGPFITKILYPTLVELSLPYMALGNLGAIMGIVGNLIQPAVLTYAPTKLQIYIQIEYGIVYLVFGIALARWGGLGGFAFAQIIANLVRIITLHCIGYKYIDK